MMAIIFLTNACQDKSSKSNSSGEIDPVGSYYLLQFIDGNEKLLFGYNDRKNSKNSLFIYEISSHRLHKPLTMNSVDYSSHPRFSHDTNQVAFVSNKGGGRNIYVMNADGSNIRQLTFSSGNNKAGTEGNFKVETNDGPSFSPDGKRIIFKRAHTLKVRKHSYGLTEAPIWWDIYEIDIQSGKERKLTNIEGHLVSDPFYFSDGERFVFYTAAGLKHKDEGVYIADNKSNVLNKISAGGWWIPGPRISRKDRIVFMSGAHTKDPEHDLFIYDNEERKKLNWIQRGSRVTNLAISPDGSKVIFETEAPKDSYKFDRSLWIGNADGTGLQKINISWEQFRDNK